MFASLRKIAIAFQGQRKIVLVRSILRIDLVRGLKQPNRLWISSVVQIEFAKSLVCLEALRSFGQSFPQSMFRVPHCAAIPTGIAQRSTLRFERERFSS